MPALFPIFLGLYSQCIRIHPGHDCQALYTPVLAQCRTDATGCQAHLAKGDLGALNFSRCFHTISCGVDTGFVARLFPGDERAEARDPFEAEFGTGMEYRLSLKISKESKLDSQNQSLVIAQLKANNDLSPPVALRWKVSEEFTVTIRHQGGEVVAYRGPLLRDRWYTFTLRVQTGEQGHVEVAQNDQLIVHYAGPVGYAKTITYFKFGPYDFTKTQKSAVEIHYGFFQRLPAVPALGNSLIQTPLYN